MAIYEYKGFNQKGKPVQGAIDADNPHILKLMLKKEGILLTEYKEKTGRRAGETVMSGGGGAIGSKQIKFKQLFGRVKTSEIAEMTRLMATLLKAGIPMVEALTAIVDQVENPTLKEVMSQVRQDMKEGVSLGGALAKHPKYFSNLYVSMVRAGESSGALDAIFSRLADFSESSVRLKSKITSAMAYPVVMMFVGIGIISLMMIFVIPKVTEIFTDMGAELPFLTQAMISMSYAFQHYWLLGLLLMFGAGYGFKRWKKSDDGSFAWDGFKLKIPLFGRLIRLMAISRFARTLGTLLQSGVPLLNALNIVKNVMTNKVLIKVVDGARDEIREGESIANPLEKSGHFPPMVTHMIRIGEKTGQLESMLENVAESYESQVESRVVALTSILEPVIILSMGIIVAMLVFAILMPMLQMNDLIQG